MKRSIAAVIIGIVAYVLLVHFRQELAQVFDDLYFKKGISFPRWASAVLTFMNPVVALLPGFLAGWLAYRRGLALGFLAGFVGGTVVLFIVLAGSAPAATEIPILFWTLMQFTVPDALTNAAAGGAAQLLRSNQRLQSDGSPAARRA